MPIIPTNDTFKIKSVDSSTTGVDSRHIRQRRQPRQDAGDYMDNGKAPT